MLAVIMTVRAVQELKKSSALQAKDRKRAAQLLELESGPFSVM